MPPGMKMTSGYGTLRNGTGGALTVATFASPAFRDVTLHETRDVDGMARMVEVENLTLAPGEALQLEPGGYHLMLMGPEVALSVDAVVPIEISTTDGGSYRFEVPVERR
jgi:copper(I)-binding protein